MFEQVVLVDLSMKKFRCDSGYVRGGRLCLLCVCDKDAIISDSSSHALLNSEHEENTEGVSSGETTHIL